MITIYITGKRNYEEEKEILTFINIILYMSH